MGDASHIEWTDATWNPTRGCSRVSEGCRNCYAERQAVRQSGPGGGYEGLVRSGLNGPRWTGVVRLVPEQLALPLRWRQPRRIFVDSMSDLFHEAITDEQIAAVFGVMAATPQHTYQVLTKRAERMAQWFERWSQPAYTTGDTGRGVYVRHPVVRIRDAAYDFLFPRDRPRYTAAGPRALTSWPLPHVWLGVSVEDQQRADERIPHLLRVPAAVRFLSVEPLLGPVDLAATSAGDALADCDDCDNHDRDCETCSGLGKIDWVIVGGESGPGARPCDLGWIRSIVEQCKAAGVPVFVKQFGAQPVERCPDCSDTQPCDGCERRAEQGHQRGLRPLALSNRKGGDWSEWPADLRVREFPR